MANPVPDATALQQPDTVRASAGKIVSRNALVNAGRVLASALVLFFVPLCLTRWMPVATYSAWVLILQLAAYVQFLDLGVQTGVAKFVAEYVERGDRDGAGKRASAGMAIMLAAALLGILLTILLAWRVPQLFATMPQSLHADVRGSVLLIGISLSIGLVGSVFSAIFLGLQQYSTPVILSISNRALFAAAVIAVAYFHGSLTEMGLAGGAVNAITVAAQFGAWRRSARFIRVRMRWIAWPVLREMLHYCMVLAVWSGAMLCISGLDVTIAGHYDFAHAGYYSVATLPNNLMIALLTAILSPLIPAASALGTHRTAAEMGSLLLRTTRYSALFLMMCGLPFIVGGYAILHLWVGPVYALHSLSYLRILVFANLIRYSLAPYATMIVALGRQKAATASCVLEAMVNLGSSLLLAQRLGAAGVAYGTLLGVFVGVAAHLALSMRHTYGQIAVRRRDLFTRSLAKPLLLSAAILCLLLLTWKPGSFGISFAALIFCELATATLGWRFVLEGNERIALLAKLRLKLGLLAAEA